MSSGTRSLMALGHGAFFLLAMVLFSPWQSASCKEVSLDLQHLSTSQEIETKRRSVILTEGDSLSILLPKETHPLPWPSTANARDPVITRFGISRSTVLGSMLKTEPSFTCTATKNESISETDKTWPIYVILANKPGQSQIVISYTELGGFGGDVRRRDVISLDVIVKPSTLVKQSH